MVRHHTIPVATITQIDWHLRNLWNGGYTTVKEVSFDEHVARHSDGRSNLQWVKNFNHGGAVDVNEAALMRMEGLL